MKSEFRIGRALDNDRERAEHRHTQDRCTLVVALLSVTLMLAMVPAAVWLHPAGLAQAQDEIGASDLPLPRQVIAQGIARLPRGEVAWTVRGIDVSSDADTPVESFPIGFAIADDATVALLDAEGEVLNILAAGEAAFLPSGKSGALSSWEADAASLYEVALVSARDAGADETSGAIVGEPFAAPEGAAFDIELAQETLTPGEQATIPVSRSGVPVLFLQTAGSVRLEGGNGQIVELAAGQFAMLSGQVVARGAGDGASTFVVAAIGEATAGREPAAAGTPEARAGREERQQAREAAAQGEDTAGAGGTREKRPKRVRTGGGSGGGGGGGQGGGQTAPQGTGGGTGGGTGAPPITGGVDATVPAGAPAGTPALEPTLEPTLPADTTADETPTPDATTPPADETAVPGDEVPADSTVTPEPTTTTGDAIPTEETTETPVPTVEALPTEETGPIEEAPVEEAPAEETVPAEPVVEEAVTDPAAGA